ncbi:rust resistance kinase Lr10-like [Aristolochia californica]|uniref:rust resistance kinase Lr10-like n=1 Tax=Aristolochia californica TaxID=171875 RepID=UPI0035D74A13
MTNALTFLFVILISLNLLPIQASQNYPCQRISCSPNGPEIRFPFRLKGKSPQVCGDPDPAFELSCDADNTTVLHLWPSSSEIYVQEIDYKLERLRVYNFNSCIGCLFFNRSLPPSPFRFYDLTFNYTFVDCSHSVYGFDEPWNPCLRNSGQVLYLVHSQSSLVDLPVSCQTVKTIELGSEYRSCPYELNLRWDLPDCRVCQDRGGICYNQNITNREIGCHLPPDRGFTTKLLACVFSGLFLVLVIILAAVKVYYVQKYSKMEKEYKLKVEKFLEDYKSVRPTRYSYAEIKRMTDNFKTRLGEGGNGSVFRGELPNGMLVAVKLLHSSNSFSDGDEFINEVSTIGRIHHVNVVRLLGFCAENLRRAIIYEFMPNESLEKFIFSRNLKAPFLGWEKLQEIALGIARGIEYLHQGCDHRILHFDIKPHNILLDQDFNPKVSDFGLAKLCAAGQSIVSVTAAKGTMGYIAPEVFSRNFGNVSHKSDVYSFGILLLEMVGGRKITDTNAEDASQVNFPEWIYRQLDEGKDLSSEIVSEGDAEIAKKLTVVGLWCIQWYPADRPSIQTAVQMLEGTTETSTLPPNPYNSSASNSENVPHFSQLPPIHE